MDAQVLVIWYLAFVLLGIIGLPLSNYFFKSWADKGYIFAKFIGLFLVAMPVWFLASIKIVPFTQTITVLVFVLALVGAAYLLYKDKFKINKYMIIEEVCFLILLVVWTSIRSYNSQIEGTEKMMNMAFMNSILRSEYFPPLDPWYSGGNINYYYLGHYMYSFLSKMLSISTGYVYNLALTTIIAQTFVSTGSILIKLFEKSKFSVQMIFAFLGSSWISFGGNMHYAFYWLQSYLTGTTFTYFFPNPTRIIPFTINEFPSYSIVLGDVHGHYIVLPYLLLAIAFAVCALSIKIKSKEKLIFNAAISIFVMTLYGINSWDVITVNFIFVLVHMLQVYSELKGDWREAVTVFFKAEAALVMPGLIFLIPYVINFHPAVGGLGFVPFDKKSEVGPWLLMWGMFIVITVFFVSFYLISTFHKKLKVAASLEKIGKEIIPAALLTVAALCLIVGVEFLFFKDIFFSSNNDYFRTNTVFKFYYHAWILWGIGATWFAYALFQYGVKKYRLFLSVSLAIFAVFYIGAISYIYKAVNDFYSFTNPKVVSVDGTAYLDLEHKGDAEVIRWINANIKGQPIILEEVGLAYTYSSRITTYTGLVTIMGWPTHEWQWRGSPDLAFPRSDDARTIYTGADEVQKANLIAKYGIEYVLVGDRERTTYGEVKEDFFKDNFKLVYDNLNTQIYKVD